MPGQTTYVLSLPCRCARITACSACHTALADAAGHLCCATPAAAATTAGASAAWPLPGGLPCSPTPGVCAVAGPGGSSLAAASCGPGAGSGRRSWCRSSALGVAAQVRQVLMATSTRGRLQSACGGGQQPQWCIGRCQAWAVVPPLPGRLGTGCLAPERLGRAAALEMVAAAPRIRVGEIPQRPVGPASSWCCRAACYRQRTLLRQPASASPPPPASSSPAAGRSRRPSRPEGCCRPG
jgi:hypothetical protein